MTKKSDKKIEKKFEKNKKLTAEIDWLRLTFIPNFLGDYKGSWLFDSQIYIIEFLKFFGFKYDIDELLSEKWTKLGYSHTYEIIDGLDIQVNDGRRDMGICFDISGKGCDNLLHHFQISENNEQLFFDLVFKKFENFKNKINDDDNFYDIFKMNVTRCDIAIDYFNYPWTVNKLYNKINNETTAIYYEKLNKDNQKYYETKSRSRLTAIMNDDAVQTFYLGKSSKGKTYQVRVYNKKLEQKEKNNIIDDSKIENYNRIEIELHGYLAKSFFKNSLKTTDKTDFIRLMFIYVCRRFRLKNKKDYHPITKEMLKIIDGKQVSDFRKIEKDKTLQDKYEYLIEYSGLVSFVQVLMSTNGEDAVDDFLENVKHLAKSRDASERTEKLINDILNQPTYYSGVILKDE